jgi:kynurenine formamidase
MTSHFQSLDFQTLYDEVCTWDTYGARGALEELTLARIVAAARLVRTGVTVSLGLPLDTEAAIDNPNPAEHRMTQLHDSNQPHDGGGSVSFAKDYVGVDFHNDGHSHVDAFSHVAYEGRIYGGQPERSVTADGAAAGSVVLLRDGLVGRGLLLDIPRTRGLPWLEPGEHVHRDDLLAAEEAQGCRVEPGDILLIRTGHARRQAELPAWDVSRAKAGLHPDTVELLAQRRIAALGSDGNSDAAPSAAGEVPFPIHVLAVNAMGLHLLDYLQFEDLSHQCERMRRWEFLFVAAPLRIHGGTGSPVNPIAIF